MERFKRYLLSKPESFECYPFGEDACVFKIKDKMFAIYVVKDSGDIHVNLKCDPNEALALRDVFEDVLPGYHMNKKHWNTVIIRGTIPEGEVERMIDRSYGLVVKGLKKVTRDTLILKYGEDEIFR